MSDVEPTLAQSGVGQVSDAAGQISQADGPGTARSRSRRSPEPGAEIDVRSTEPVLDVSDTTPAIESDRAEETDDGHDLRRRRLFDLNFVDAADLGPVLESLLRRRRPADDSMLETVLTPNVDIMIQLTRPGARSSIEWNMFARSQYCLPDGQPIVLASRLLGRPLRARLTGSGLFALLWPRLVAERRPVFVVASSGEIVERLGREYADVRSVVAPMFDADDSATIEQLARSVVESAGESPLDYVVLGIGNPKDARIAEAVLRLWPESYGRPPALLALGGSASMYVGLTRRAPDWVQRIGMEWFYRFLQEPRRLFHRYFVRDVGFVKLVWQHWRSDRRIARPATDRTKQGGGS